MDFKEYQKEIKGKKGKVANTANKPRPNVQRQMPRQNIQRPTPSNNPINRVPQNVQTQPIKKSRVSKKLKILIILLLILLTLVVTYGILYINIFSYKNDVKEVLTLSGDTNVTVVEDIKIDSDKTVYAYTKGDELCATLVQVKQSGDEKMYKSLKRTNSIDLSEYKSDDDTDVDYTSYGSLKIALDVTSSNKYKNYQEYLKDDKIKNDKASPINVDGYDDLFVLWSWYE